MLELWAWHGPGIIKGKFSYLSPEAAKGGVVDARTDIFAVGIILWELLLAGRRLFMGESDLETVRMVQAARVPSIRELNKNVSADLEQVLMKALTEDPETRETNATRARSHVPRVARATADWQALDLTNAPNSSLR